MCVLLCKCNYPCLIQLVISLLSFSPLPLFYLPSSLPPASLLSVLFESQASCHMWLERLRQVTRGAKDLEKTFAFVHWAYSKDQQQQQQQTTVAITEHTHTYNNNNGSVITPVNSLRDHQNSWNSGLL